MEDVRTQRTVPVPVHLRDRHYSGAKRLGHGDGYEYPHSAKDGWVAQDYLGVDARYYEPVERGYEVELKRRLDDLRARRSVAAKNSSAETDGRGAGPRATPSGPPDNLASDVEPNKPSGKS